MNEDIFDWMSVCSGNARMGSPFPILTSEASMGKIQEFIAGYRMNSGFTIFEISKNFHVSMNFSANSMVEWCVFHKSKMCPFLKCGMVSISQEGMNRLVKLTLYKK